MAKVCFVFTSLLNTINTHVARSCIDRASFIDKRIHDIKGLIHDVLLQENGNAVSIRPLNDVRERTNPGLVVTLQHGVAAHMYVVVPQFNN